MQTNFLPIGAIPMTGIITDCHSTIETRIVCQLTGNTLNTNYHNDLNSAVDFAEQFPIDRIEYETL